MNIYEKLKELGLPLGEYVVTGGAMAAHGIREAHDLDIIVTPNLYQRLSKQGFKPCNCEQCLRTGRIILKAKDVDILPDYTYEKYIGDVETLIRDADMINGYPFIKLAEFVKFKRELGRPKDMVDIKLIEDYLDKKKSTARILP